MRRGSYYEVSPSLGIAKTARRDGARRPAAPAGTSFWVSLTHPARRRATKRNITRRSRALYRALVLLECRFLRTSRIQAQPASHKPFIGSRRRELEKVGPCQRFRIQKAIKRSYFTKLWTSLRDSQIRHQVISAGNITDIVSFDKGLELLLRGDLDGTRNWFFNWFELVWIKSDTLFTIYWKLLGIGLAVDLFNAYQHYMDKTLGGTGKGTANWPRELRESIAEGWKYCWSWYFHQSEGYHFNEWKELGQWHPLN